MIPKSQQNAFTLVELAIAMTIIGLLIGGVLKATELLDNARVKRTISQINEFRAATSTFFDRYQQLPGDMTSATRRIPGCFAPECLDGNGNAVIGVPDLPNAGGYYIPDAQTDVLPCGGMCEEEETVMFWQHLVRADLISQVKPFEAPYTQADLDWGQSHPAAPFQGGVHIAVKAGYYGGKHRRMHDGHYLIYRNSMFGSVNGCPDGQCNISYLRGLQIDKMLDDGDSVSGTVVVDGSVTCTAPAPSQIKNHRQDCNLYVRFWK